MRQGKQQAVLDGHSVHKQDRAGHFGWEFDLNLTFQGKVRQGGAILIALHSFTKLISAGQREKEFALGQISPENIGSNRMA